jgi:GNAT superfamily N-acetyltransferase
VKRSLRQKIQRGPETYLVFDVSFRTLGGRGIVAIEALEGSVERGALILIDTDDGFLVPSLSVRSRFRRQRIGTALYEIASHESCRLGRPLSSDIERSRYSEAFWRKQVSKGRATCLLNEPARVGPGGKDEPGLPVPENGWWPCFQYSLTCPPPPSLEGGR